MGQIHETMERTHTCRRLQIPESLHGARLDLALARLLPDYSRNRIQAWIRSGRVRVGGARRRPRDPVRAGERVELEVDTPAALEDRPQAMALQILFEDAHLLVLYKPPGLVVHPGAGNREGTLLNALLHHSPASRSLPRAGLVHRLDKDTSGVLVVAKTEPAQTRLVAAMQARRIRREYLALVQGRVIAGGSVDAPIGRHPVHRTRMAVVPTGRPAVTHYRVERRFGAHTLLRVRLETGRTHQIRVHMAHLRHPLVGDPVYGGRPRLTKGMDPSLAEALRAWRRQALHAHRLRLEHPMTGAVLEWEAPPPEDFATLLRTLEQADALSVLDPA